MQLASIAYYPLKSAAAISVARWRFDALGLQHDRRLMLLDQHNRFVSQREIPALACLSCRYESTQGQSSVAQIRLQFADSSAQVFQLAPPSADAVALATLWADDIPVVEPSLAASLWLSMQLSQPLRLVQMAAGFQRSLDPEFDHLARSTVFADGFPFLLCNTGTLAALNQHIVAGGDEPVPMSRFRPNLVIDGADAGAEDRWQIIEIDGQRFHLVKPCARCKITTIEQLGQRAGQSAGKQPLRSLAATRCAGGEVFFGQNVIAEALEGELEVGMPVRVIC